MSIISTIGRKQNKVRGLFLGMYVFLIIGGATMVYPFLLMISGSMKSAMDIKHFDVCPRFLYDRDWMWGKHAEGLFNEYLAQMKYAYNEGVVAFDRLGEQPLPHAARAEAWERFITECPMPDYAYFLGYCIGQQSKTIPYCRREFKNMLDDTFDGDITAVNRAYQTEFSDWQSVTLSFRTMYMRRNKPYDTPYTREMTRFLSRMPVGLRVYFSPRGFFVRMYLKARYAGARKADGTMGTDLEAYNVAHGTAYGDWREIPLPRRFPSKADSLTRTEWEQYVRTVLCSAWIRVDGTALGAFQAYLRAKYPDADGRAGLDILNERYGTAYASFAEVPVSVGNVERHRKALRERFSGNVASFNEVAGTAYASFDDVPLRDEPPYEGIQGADWDGFLIGAYGMNPDGTRGRLLQAPVESLRIQSPDTQFQDWVMATYGTLESANAALGTAWKSVEDIALIQKDAHLKYMDDHIGDLRLEFVTRNYKAVLDYMLFHGRGILNTIIFCGLSILVALLVNPLAAYAMSRYRMPSSYKILLFLMCTMAFPPMVTAIPNFILLRQFNMLNTFWALILPGMANGYSIFLLKGFFDSLPQELYESAQLDGATEWTLFWQITMGLSKPILAVIALNSFMASYAAYMFAFVICQDKKMWTMMVWLYEMQQNYGQGVVYASLVIAAVPTFLIFLFCQNIIMRGIVVPSEK